MRFSLALLFHQVISGDPYNSDPEDPQLMGPEARARVERGEQQAPTVKRRVPLVELPLGATEDRVCGTIDIEKALAEGVRAFEPGLLAKANRGILFVDEVNMLDDSLVDVVLDSAAGGWNTVEREGVSILHPAKFIMIGSGNPEEGEMRPQLLDRFGMAVNVGTLVDADARVQLVLSRIAYEQDAEAFAASCAAETEALRSKLAAARERLPRVKCDRGLVLKISELCSMINVDGLRGDITTNRAARALAALEGVEEVTDAHVARVASLCLSHRLRKDPMDALDNGSKVAIAFRRVFARDAASQPVLAKKPPPPGAAAPKPGPPAPPAGGAAKPGAPPAAAEKKKAGAWGGMGR